jgi:inner membrane transporter RhtA
MGLRGYRSDEFIDHGSHLGDLDKDLGCLADEAKLNDVGPVLEVRRGVKPVVAPIGERPAHRVHEIEAHAVADKLVGPVVTVRILPVKPILLVLSPDTLLTIKTPLTGETQLTDRIPPHLWFVGSAIFHYLGPSFAVLLFARVPVGGVAFLRIASAAAVFAVWRRPWNAFAAANPHTRRSIVTLGLVFAAMNYCFYNAIERLPLGTVAAIEFLGPIALAITGTRTKRNLAALALAITGVYLLTDVRLGGDAPAFAWAFANAALFTAYIVLAHRIARADPSSPIDRLGAAMLVAAVIFTPLGIWQAHDELLDPVAVLAGIGVGISSSVLPYVFDQIAMTRLPRPTYALFVALLPATAIIIGVIVLTQIPTTIEIIAVALVIIGVLLHHDTESSNPQP